jgi:hypothetical protein
MPNSDRDPANDHHDEYAHWPRFTIGEKVIHEKSGRRGVVVARPSGTWGIGKWSGLFVRFDGYAISGEVWKIELRKLTVLDELAEL